MIKRLLIFSLVAIAAVSSMAQGRSIHPDDRALWVINGLVMDTTSIAKGEFVPDSVEPWLKRYYPLIKLDDIKEIRLMRSGDIAPTACYANGKIILITTHEDSGLRDLELNGVYTSKRKRIGLEVLSNKTVSKHTIEKTWKIKHIQSIQIHPEGKTVLDRKGHPHTIYLSITTY
mgnify:CR=1 FL=1